jgi:N-formylmaleamate deformylase
MTYSTWQTGDLIANDIRLHYTRTGGGKPALVLAHGVTDSGLCWTPVAGKLAADFDVIMVDARGHGESESPETGYDAATQAADLAGLIECLRLHKPALMGHSMGAVSVLALAGLYPDVPAAVVLEDPPPFWARPAQPAPPDEQRATAMRTWMESLRGKTREQLIEDVRQQSPTWPEAELGPWADAKVAFARNRVRPWTPSAHQPDWPAILRRITAPVLAIAADGEKGAALSDEGIATLKAAVPHAEVVRLAGAGHNIRREQTAAFMAAVSAFLKKALSSH